MKRLEDRLAELGLTLPTPAAPVASYVPAVTMPAGVPVYISGQIPLRDGKLIAQGQVGTDVPFEVARDCARQCALNALAALRAEIGDLARLRRVIRVGGFVACSPHFMDHSKVINGASDLLVELLGDAGRHARAAVGVPSLPLGAPVEVEFLFTID
jgi:enamine deaminase RidA (YjgF/YER057c/UK114 family)